MLVNLKLEEDELGVLEFCVDEILSKWKKTYEEECQDKELQKNPIALETLGYKKDWIDNMESILKKVETLKELIEKQYKR